MRVSSAKVVFTDSERLPIVLEATAAVGISKQSIYMIDVESTTLKTNGSGTISQLLTDVQPRWDEIDDVKVLTDRLVKQNLNR